MLNSQIILTLTRQRGAAVVEFGIVAMLFFTVFFGIIEFGRLFYLYNTVQEVTRCAARAATVTWRDSDSWDYTKPNSIQKQCLFGQDELAAGWEVHGVSIRLRALNLDYDEVDKNDPSSAGENIANCIANQSATNCIRFVEASIWCDTEGEYCHNNRVMYQPMFGLTPLSVSIAPATVVMPAEGLGN